MKPDRSLNWPIAYEAVELIAEVEGCRLTAYRCPAGVPTIGWGHTRGVRMGDTCTQEQADRWLLDDVTEMADGVRSVLKREAAGAELGAMVSLAFNIGMGSRARNIAGFETSTVLRKHNEGDRQAAARAFGLWNKATVNGVKQVLPGLTARRAREAALYLSDQGQPMAQAVLPESSMAQSPIAQASVTAAATALAGVLTESTDTGQAIAAALGIEPMWGVLLAVLWTSGVALYQRIKQRREGWA